LEADSLRRAVSELQHRLGDSTGSTRLRVKRDVNIAAP
jgi:hypothetical protein